jgi:hypothetical protein
MSGECNVCGQNGHVEERHCAFFGQHNDELISRSATIVRLCDIAKSQDSTIKDLRAQLAAAHARIGRLQREILARRQAEYMLGWGGTDEASRCAAQVCDAHNDLNTEGGTP